MITPAKELAMLVHNVFEEGYSDNHDRERLAMHCGELLLKIDSFLDAAASIGKPYQFFQEGLRRNSRIILQIAIGYEIEESEIDHAVFVLNAIDAVMEKDEFEPFKAQPEDVRGIAAELKNLLADSADLSPDLRLYCSNVIALVEQELQRFEISNEFDTQAAVERLTAAINVLLFAEEGTKSSRFQTLQDIWNKLMGLANFSNSSISAVNGAVKLAELAGGQG